MMRRLGFKIIEAGKNSLPRSSGPRNLSTGQDDLLLVTMMLMKTILIITKSWLKSETFYSL